jgi:hypothetical protein
VIGDCSYPSILLDSLNLAFGCTARDLLSIRLVVATLTRWRPRPPRAVDIGSMTTYTKRDIRAADLLALLLFGLGFVLVLFAAIPLIASLGGAEKIDKAAVAPQSSFGLWFAGGCFLLLGTALNLKVREIIRNKGREAADYEGVSE